MFNAEGKRLLQEKHTGTVEEQLRSLTSERLLAEIKVEQDKLGECIRLLKEAIEASPGCTYCLRNREVAPPPVSKTYQSCLKLLKAYTDKLKDLQAKVDAHEEGIHLMTRNLLTDVNRLVINVPVQAQHRRTFTMPHEQDSRKKRKMPGPRKPEDKKGRRLRTLKPQKVTAPRQARKKKTKQLPARPPSPILSAAEAAPPRWQEEPYRQPTVAVKLEPVAVAFNPTQMFAAIPTEIFDDDPLQDDVNTNISQRRVKDEGP